MTTTDRVLAAAHEYGEKYFHPAPLSAVEVFGQRIFIGKGYESWLVRVESKSRSIITSVVVAPDGHTEVTHHTRSAA
jgi:hypothetical protein